MSQMNIRHNGSICLALLTSVLPSLRKLMPPLDADICLVVSSKPSTMDSTICGCKLSSLFGA